MNEPNNIRPQAVAGSFYPGDPAALTKLIAKFYAQADKKPFHGRPIAVIAPHAGYNYSGKTAAFAYKQLVGEEYDTVIVISPSHTIFFQGSSVFNGSAYSTPLGEIRIDSDLSRTIASIHPSIYLSNKGHTGGSVRGEHSLEVQLPFLQQALGKFKLVAIVMGEQEESTCRSLGEVLASALTGRNYLIVASTDLSHFHPEKEARNLDGEIRKAIEKYNPNRLLSVLASGRGEACGGGPVAATLIASKRLGGETVVVTDYSTSGETTGDFSEVVGYLSAVIVSSKPVPKTRKDIGIMAKKASTWLTKENKKELIDIAKKAIDARLNNEKDPEDIPTTQIMKEKRGAFVTLKIDSMLRGCIGIIRAAKPLYEVVREMAVAAAFEDTRFMPLRREEFDNLEIEISVITPLVRVHDLEEIKIGRDGLMIRLDFHSGLLLPQVATEHNWDRMAFLEQACLKAGLPKNSYKEKAAEIYRFSAQIF